MRFELLDELGSGAAGVVHRAQDLETGEIVAVKILHSTRAPSTELLLARKITHRNVCRVYDLYKEGDQSLFSMEFVEGETLRTLLDRKCPCGSDEMLRIAGQIMDGLEEAHRCGVVHRDLKPENIMISRDGCVKLMDFGSAGSGDPADTFRNQRTGTSPYLAPEQSALLLEADPRSDIYSLGVILHETIERGMWVEVSSHVRDVLFRCMQKDPAQRFGSIAELRNAIAMGMVVGAGGVARVAKLQVSQPSVVLSAAAVCAGLALTGFYIFFQTPPNVPTVTAIAEPVALPRPQVPAKPSIALAVLPFINVAKNPELALLEDRAGETIRNSLLRSGRFRIVERPEAPYWLVGSFMEFEGQVQMNARVIRAQTAEAVFGESETAGLESAAALPGRIADRLIAGFKP
jgi:TolB-like protein